MTTAPPQLKTRITRIQARSMGYRAMTNYYGPSTTEQEMLGNVVRDQDAACADYVLVINPADTKETAVWAKNIRRFRDLKKVITKHITPSNRKTSNP